MCEYCRSNKNKPIEYIKRCSWCDRTQSESGTPFMEIDSQEGLLLACSACQGKRVRRTMSGW
jgi:hypothetical protein